MICCKFFLFLIKCLIFITNYLLVRVNDFDDEVTLNEEEAQEDQLDPADEIAALQEEGDMPLEELLAKYGSAFATPLAPLNSPPKSRKRKSAKRDAAAQAQKKLKEVDASSEEISEEASTSSTQLADKAESMPEETESPLNENNEENAEEDETAEQDDDVLLETPIMERMRPLRSHLLDLYPEDCFNVAGEAEGGKLS